MVQTMRAENAPTRLTRLISNESAPTNAGLFVRAVLEEWKLSDMAEEASEGVAELIDWARRTGTSLYVEVAVIWDGPLLFTEITDHDDKLPEPPLKLGCRAEECGAEHTDRGRCIWASYRTGRREQLPVAS
jgi:hypothetical protein